MTNLDSILKSRDITLPTKIHIVKDVASPVVMYGCEGDPGLTPGLGRSPGEGSSNPLQYSCLEKSMGRGAWQATIHLVSRSQTGCD